MKNPEPRRRWIPLGVLSLALSGLSCATSGGGEGGNPGPSLGATMDALAEELAQAARQRIDLSSMRVCLRDVTEIQADDPPPLSAGYWMTDLDYLAEEITEELELALSSRFHLIDSDLFGEPAQATGLNGRENGSLLAEHFGATHLVVGTLAPHGEALQLKLRLVDAGNWVIVAVARGTVPVEALSDRSRVAFGNLPPYLDPIFPQEEFLEEPFDDPAVTAWPEEITMPDVGVASVSEDYLLPQPQTLEPIVPLGPGSGYAAWKPPKKEPSDRTELDLLLHSRVAYREPVESPDPQEPIGRAGPGGVRFAALGRKLK